MRLPAAAACLALACLAPAQDQGDPVQNLVERIDRIVEPRISAARMSEPGYLASVQAEIRERLKIKTGLIMELARERPSHPRLASLLDFRWAAVDRIARTPEERDALSRACLAEIEALASGTGPGGPPSDGVRRAAAYWKAFFTIRLNRADAALVARTLAAYAADPEASRTRVISLHTSAAFTAPTEEESLAIFKALAALWPGDPALLSVRGIIHRLEGRGRPLDYSFSDFATGRKVDLAGWKGRVVLIEFFSPTLETSARRLPYLKMLQEELGPQGLEIVMICLDDETMSGQVKDGGQKLAGKDLLRAWISERHVPWPVSWKGAEGQKEWVEGWGVVALPAVFALDRRGCLRIVQLSSNLKGELEELIKEKP